MPFDAVAAKAAGYSDDEINSFLSQPQTSSTNFDYDGAKAAGYSDQEIQQHLASTSPQSTSFSQDWHNAGADEPGYTYGNVLPYKTNNKTGEASWAMPEAIRSPLRGIGDMFQTSEERDPSAPVTPDELSAISTVAGMTPALRGASPIASKAAGAVDDFLSKSSENGIGSRFPLVEDNAAKKIVPYDADATHAAISDAYGEAKSKVAPYYNLMKDIGSGETADASGLKPQLQSMISDIENTPFHEATSELPYLRSQAAKIDDNGTMPLNDMVKLKQNLNSNFNPKRFTNATDTPYSNASSIVDNSLNEASQRIPEFGEAKQLADKNWLNTVKSPFEDNTILQKFWKPEDYFAKKSVDSGMLEDMPDPTQQRAQQMLSNINTPVELNAVRRVLPQDLSDSLSQAKIGDITQGVGVGRLQSAGKAAYYGVTGRLPSALRNTANVINPSYTPEEQALLQVAKSPAPTLSTKYEKPYRDLKASVQQMKDSASEMQPMNYAPPSGKSPQQELEDIADQQYGDFMSRNGYKKGGQVKEPSEAQKHAGNYKKEHISLHGLNIAIENPKGSFRSGTDKDGKRWRVKMPVDYGYIKGHMGADGDHIDCFVGPRLKSENVYIIDQKDPHTGKFDEHKIMLGFPAQGYALAAYRKSFSDSADGRIHAISKLSIQELKQWLDKIKKKESA